MNVKKIQCLLYACDIDPGPIDGVLGEKTKAALNKLHIEYGVHENCLIDVLSGKIQRVTDDDFWKTVRHFKKKEFACPCGECNGFPVEINKKLVTIIDDIREECGYPSIVSSGVRCAKHNLEVGGVINSKHLSGDAVDFCVTNVSGTNLNKIIAKHKEIKYHYIIKGDWCHMNL